MLKTIFMLIFVTTVWPIVMAAGDSCPKSTSTNNACGVEGIWRNQLNSTAEFQCCANGQLRGKYRSAVGAAENFYILSGRYTMTGPDQNVTVLGWVVAYNNTVRGNSNSTASWSGIYYPDEGIIYTQWILVRYTDRADMWQSSWINHDEFHRDGCT